MTDDATLYIGSYNNIIHKNMYISPVCNGKKLPSRVPLQEHILAHYLVCNQYNWEPHHCKTVSGIYIYILHSKTHSI